MTTSRSDRQYLVVHSKKPVLHKKCGFFLFSAQVASDLITASRSVRVCASRARALASAPASHRIFPARPGQIQLLHAGKYQNTDQHIFFCDAVDKMQTKNDR
jgi:hypothetical protein